MYEEAGYYERIGSLVPDRTFQNNAGEPCRVRELPPADTLGIPRSLVFEGPLFARRVRNFPDDWRGLDARGLETLSWHR